MLYAIPVQVKQIPKENLTSWVLGHRTEQAIQFGHDDHRLALSGSGEKLASRRTTGERLARADSGILELLGTAALPFSFSGSARRSRRP